MKQKTAIDTEAARTKILIECAVMHFECKGYPIKKELADKIMADLVYLFNLQTSEILIAIMSSDTPQDFFDKCLDNYYNFFLFSGE